jgi:hypothetical protein
MPPTQHKDYLSWVRVQLAGVDLHCTPTEAESWIKKAETLEDRIDWKKEDLGSPSLKQCARDLLQTQLDEGEVGAIDWINKMRSHKIKSLKDWQGQPGITEELIPSTQQKHRVTDWESGLLIRAETARWMIDRRDPSINVRIHETRHWSLCTDDHCLIHLMEKGEYDYWPRPGIKPDRTGKTPEGKRARVWNSDFPTKMILSGGILEETISRRHRESDWKKCWYGTCQIHLETKRMTGHWPKGPPNEDLEKALEALANETSDSGNE